MKRLLILLWVALTFAAAAQSMQVEVPAEAIPGEPFLVKVTGPPDGVEVELLLLSSGGTASLTGTLTATVHDGEAIFPEVRLAGEVELVRIAASAGSEMALSGPIDLLPPDFGSARFEAISTQVDASLFEVLVQVSDTAGEPLPGARVTIRIDPERNHTSFLFIKLSTGMQDESRQDVEQMTAESDGDGYARFRVRVSNGSSAYYTGFAGTVEYLGRTWEIPPSNSFDVYTYD